MKIQQHGLAVGAQKNVRRLEIKMNQVVFLGIRQGIRQTSADPADGVHVGHSGKEVTIRAAHGNGLAGALPNLLEGLDQVRPLALCRRTLVVEDVEELPQRGPAKVRHAQSAQMPDVVVVHGVERHDIRMLQLR